VALSPGERLSAPRLTQVAALTQTQLNGINAITVPRAQAGRAFHQHQKNNRRFLADTHIRGLDTTQLETQLDSLVPTIFRPSTPSRITAPYSQSIGSLSATQSLRL